MCEYCERNFKNIKTLEKHYRTAKLCMANRGVVYMCQRCRFTAKNLQTVRDHIIGCTGDIQLPVAGSIYKHVQRLEDNNHFFECKATDLGKELEKTKALISKLSLRLKGEQLKTAIYGEIIQCQTNLKLENIFNESLDGIHVYNYDEGHLPVIVHNHIRGRPKTADNDKSLEPKKYVITTTKKKKKTEKPGQTYRSVKAKVELIEEKPVEIEEKIKQVEETFDEIERENFDVSQKETVKRINELIIEVENSRIYTKNLHKIRDKRSKLLGKVNLPEYIEMIRDHVNRLAIVFTAKSYEKRKRTVTIAKSLTPLEQRLIHYGKYYDTTLEPDEIQQLKLTLNVNTEYSKKYTPLDRNVLYGQFYNYSVAIYPIFETIQRVFINPYGFSNIGYLDLPKSDPTDPYSFYSLEKVEGNGKRLWKMELRLEDVCRELASHLRQYCVKLFRTIYFDIFNDNTYREDYASKTQITQQDCEQLIINILVLSRPIDFCRRFREMIVEHATIPATELDKFNLTADDRLQKKYFAKTKDEDEDMDDFIKQLFDGISKDDAREVWGDKV